MAISTFDLVAPQIVGGLDDFGAALTRGFMERNRIRDARNQREQDIARQERAAKAKLAREQRAQMDDVIAQMMGQQNARSSTRARQQKLPAVDPQFELDFLQKAHADRATEIDKLLADEMAKAREAYQQTTRGKKLMEKGPEYFEQDFMKAWKDQKPSRAVLADRLGGELNDTSLKALAAKKFYEQNPDLLTGAGTQPKTYEELYREAIANPQFRETAFRRARGLGIPEDIALDFLGGMPAHQPPLEQPALGEMDPLARELTAQQTGAAMAPGDPFGMPQTSLPEAQVFMEQAQTDALSDPNLPQDLDLPVAEPVTGAMPEQAGFETINYGDPGEVLNSVRDRYAAELEYLNEQGTTPEKVLSGDPDAIMDMQMATENLYSLMGDTPGEREDYPNLWDQLLEQTGLAPDDPIFQAHFAEELGRQQKEAFEARGPNLDPQGLLDEYNFVRDLMQKRMKRGGINKQALYEWQESVGLSPRIAGMEMRPTKQYRPGPEHRRSEQLGIGADRQEFETAMTRPGLLQRAMTPVVDPIAQGLAGLGTMGGY